MKPDPAQLNKVKQYNRLDQFMTRLESQKGVYMCQNVRPALFNIFDKVRKDEQQDQV